MHIVLYYATRKKILAFSSKRIKKIRINRTTKEYNMKIFKVSFFYTAIFEQTIIFTVVIICKTIFMNTNNRIAFNVISLGSDIAGCIFNWYILYTLIITFYLFTKMHFLLVCEILMQLFIIFLEKTDLRLEQIMFVEVDGN
jgi:hypothetical protein